MSPVAERAGMGELLGRVREATGPDRELDARLWAELDDRDVREHQGMLLAKSRRAPHDECLLGNVDPGVRERNFTPAFGHHPPIACYTASVDAALALVERLHVGSAEYPTELTLTSVGGRRPWSCAIWIGSEETDGRYHKASTAPIAILAALLSALTQDTP